jgi:hypothetical protein
MPCEPSVQTVAKTYVRTLRLKVKSESCPWLNAAAAEVNVVWNYANEISARAARSATIQRVNAEFAIRRNQFKKMRPRWRGSRDPRKSLGWVPFKAEQLKRQGKCVRFCGKSIRVFEQASWKINRQSPAALPKMPWATGGCAFRWNAPST